ncbi:MAG: transposase [Xanthobacteraceae bacterium]
MPVRSLARLVPRQNSSGDRQGFGGFSKQGDCYVRYLLVVGGTAVIRHRGKRTPADR